ncbi:Putative AC9 transposase [Fusarium oxysporum f. sp. cubense race 1]|uniref:Putative AC9 transposase n=1 Tax=Fusarium oxysporum f. sp. cubense (strain race 1) TaxID=1229664 RepID=N4U0U7_FUSC1|nr:Putative AC9 transposase [Fusarium oxysporum f. sp. cubense race 1]
MRHIAENHVFYRDQIKDKLAIASSPIHISTDLWTSPHRHALLAVCAQWVDQDYQLQKALLGLPECHGSHSGERQADLIMSILKTFGIMSKLGYHTGDNATSNNTCLESIAHRLKENLDIDYDPKKRRIRCIGHIINLSLQAFLLGSSNEALVAALEAASEVTSEDLQLWDDEVGLRLGIDNETRWSSWYHVLDKLFKKKAQIVQFMHENEQILGENRLTAADWDLLQKAYLFLHQPIEIDSTPLQWWCASEQRRRYPRLSRMAIAILSISPESSEPERAFSGARRTCSWDRLRIKCANIERVECIGSWLREGHIIPTSRGGFGLPMMFSALKDNLTNSDDDLEDREDID